MQLKKLRNSIFNKAELRAQGTDVMLTPAEFLVLILENNHIGTYRLDELFGYHRGYTVSTMSGNIHVLPEPIQGKLAHLTGTESSLWSRKQYRLEDATNIQFIPERTATHVSEPHNGAHTKRLLKMQQEGKLGTLGCA